VLPPEKPPSRRLGIGVEKPHSENPTFLDLAFSDCKLSNAFGTYNHPLASQRDNLINMNSRPVRCSESIQLMILGVCVLWSGCRPGLDDPTMWKAEVRSPDGSWIASARTVEGGGFGTGYLDTLVNLQQTDSSGTPFGTPVEVLGFSCNNNPVPHPYTLDNVANAGGTIDLTMKWVTRSHLEVTYDRHPDLYFQVVKALGVDISLRDLSSAPNASEK
jgi:hypothetical protein